jgi:protein PhnA
MNVEKMIKERAENKCELCNIDHSLSVFTVPPNTEGNSDSSVYLCETCQTQIQNTDTIDINHWRCLNDSMWSEVPAVQVLAWRMLNQLNSEGWATDLLDQMNLADEVLKWAKIDLLTDVENEAPTIDSNGARLNNGDSVTIIKDLDVKGANFTAKRGTIVRKISLTDDPTHIEGRVSGQQIYLKTSFLKKV